MPVSYTHLDVYKRQHMDEKTPHLHLVFVPLTKDNRLCAKEIIGNRANLTKWQDEDVYKRQQYRYFISLVTDEIGDNAYIESIVWDKQIPETERKAIIQSRVGQGIFRKALLDKYHGRCIVTGIDHPKLLVASHIKPWAVSSNTERLSEDNGLLLSATYDRLFDSGLITFDRHGKIYLSSLIGIENIKRLGLSNNMCFNLMINMNMGEYLDYHNDVLFVR